MMISALMACGWMLMCSALSLFALLLLFAVFFAEGTLNHCVATNALAEDSTAELRANFGNVTRAIFSLFKAMSGGDDWGAIYEYLDPLGWQYKAAFIFWIVFAVIALMNVVTAIFVESTMARSQNDRELMTHKELMAKKDFLETMQSVFNELDDDGDNTVNFDELETKLKDHKIGAYFSSLGVDVDQVKKLFTLLDADGSGNVDSEEFMYGCLKLKGEAKSLDIAILHSELRTIKQRTEQIFNICLDELVDDNDDGEVLANDELFAAFAEAANEGVETEV